MADKVTAEEVLAAHQVLAEKRGFGFFELEWVARQDPEFEMARLRYSEAVNMREPPALPVKIREMIVAVVIAFRGHHTVGLHVRRALQEGATMQEVLEAFEVATVPGGMPVLHFALPFLIEIEKEEAAKRGQS